MTLSHTEKMKVCNKWIEYIKSKKRPVHIEELREFAEINYSKKKKISYNDFYELKSFFNWKFQNVVSFDKSSKCYEIIKIELDEEEAKTLV